MEHTKKKRREIFDEMTKRLILDAALKTLLEEGVEGFTMDRVAQEAGVAKGTLYLHFKDKEVLLIETIEKGFEPFFSKAETIFNSDQSPDRKLEAFALEGFLFFEQQRQLFNIVMRTKGLGHRRAIEDDAPYWNLVNKLAQVLNHGVRDGLFKAIDTTKVAGMIMDAHGALLLQHLVGKSTSNAQEQVKLIVDVFLNGIRA